MVISEAFIHFDIELGARGMSLKTRKNYRTALNSFVNTVGDVPVELLTFEHVTRWQTFMQTYMQPSAIKSNLCKLREVCKFLRRQGFNVIDSRDIELPSVPKKPPVWLDSGEVQSVLNVIESPRDRALFVSLFASGARISELLQLDRDTISREPDGTGQAYIIGKGDKPGILYFDPLAMQLIDEYLATRKDSLKPLFVSGHYRRITVSRVEQLLHIYEDKAGLDKNLTPHTLRRSFASDLIAQGASIYDTSKLLRHSQIATTVNHYAFVKDEHNKATHQRFHSQLSR